jgi:carboxymethylenebutenolidase
MNILMKNTLLALMLGSFLVPVQVSAKEGSAKTLKTRTGMAFQVYESGPQDATRGLVLVHGWLGLDDSVRSWADKFAAQGYRVMAVDLYNGNVANSPDKARAYMNAVKQSEANAKYSATIEALQMPGRKLAIVGWSFGGSQAYQASLVSPEKIFATVMYYPFGKIMQEGNDVATLNGPVLVIRSKLESPANIEETTRFIAQARAANKSVTEYTFDAKHGFANPASKNYSAPSAQAAWDTTAGFLETELNQ